MAKKVTKKVTKKRVKKNVERGSRTRQLSSQNANHACMNEHF